MSRSMTPEDEAYEELVGAARDAFRAREIDRAEELARKALSQDPKRAAAYNILAALRELQGQQAEAMDLLRAGLAVEPTYEPAQENLERLGSHPYESVFLLGDETA